MTVAAVRSRTPTLTAAVLLAGASTAVALGVYGSVHDGSGRSLVTLVFTETINLKVWLATFAVSLVLFQLGSGLRIYGVLGTGPAPGWLSPVHRLSGTGAFLLSIPVAYHCLWALGFQGSSGARLLIHSLFGCLFYGTLVTKVLFVRGKWAPNWAIPMAGGLLFTALVTVWFTSSFWFFTNVEFPGF